MTAMRMRKREAGFKLFNGAGKPFEKLKYSAVLGEVCATAKVGEHWEFSAAWLSEESGSGGLVHDVVRP